MSNGGEVCPRCYETKLTARDGDIWCPICCNFVSKLRFLPPLEHESKNIQQYPIFSPSPSMSFASPDDRLLIKFNEHEKIPYTQLNSKTKQRLLTLLQKLENGTRVTGEETIWLREKDFWTFKIAQAYHSIEARYFEREYHRTQDLWNIVNASSHWRQARHSQKAISLTGSISFITVQDLKLKAALFTTRGGALRDEREWAEAKICALKAMHFQSEDYRPFTLMGAIHYDCKEYSEGDFWFEEASVRGAPADEIDGEIKRILRRLKKEEREQVIVHLMQKDSSRYSWLQKEMLRRK